MTLISLLQMGPSGVASSNSRLKVKGQTASEIISCLVMSPQGQWTHAKSVKRGRGFGFIASLILQLSEEVPRFARGCVWLSLQETHRLLRHASLRSASVGRFHAIRRTHPLRVPHAHARTSLQAD